MRSYFCRGNGRHVWLIYDLDSSLRHGNVSKKVTKTEKVPRKTRKLCCRAKNLNGELRKCKGSPLAHNSVQAWGRKCLLNVFIYIRIKYSRTLLASFKVHYNISSHFHKFSLALLRANVTIHQTNSGKSPKFVFTPTFIFCSPICSNNCGVVFL